MQAAQSQHYVPQFILRQFLYKEKHEQVAVFDKKTGKTFTPPIHDIMTERRYNEFVYMDVLFSFEEASTRIENHILPTYRSVVNTRRITGDGEALANLSMLLAFQFSRTRNKRSLFVDIEKGMSDLLKRQGRSIKEIAGYEELTENSLKKRSLMFLQKEFPRFSEMMLAKDIFLMEAPRGRSFYIGDDPVVLHNDNSYGARSNIGLMVPGIQIAMPISRDLLLCAWCPSAIRSLLAATDETMPEFKRRLFKVFLRGGLTSEEVERGINNYGRKARELITAIDDGIPIVLTDENIDFYNSEQVANASRWIICPDNDFRLARDYIAKYPKHRRGITFS